MRALCLHLNEAMSMFQLSRDPRTFFALDQAIDNLTFAQNVCRGSVHFMVFALMGFPYESAPLPSQVATSLQSRRSKLRHSHEGHNTMFHHVDHHALESAMSRALGLWYPTGCATSFSSSLIWLESTLPDFSTSIRQRYF